MLIEIFMFWGLNVREEFKQFHPFDRVRHLIHIRKGKIKICFISLYLSTKLSIWCFKAQGGIYGFELPQNEA